jgi:MFS family permease
MSTYLPAMVLALGTGIALPAVPTLARSFHISFGLATGVTTSFLLGTVIGTVPTGWIIDRIGRRRVMLTGPLLTAGMAFLTVTAHSFPELLLYRFFDGFASQMWLLGRMAAIAHGTAANQRGKQVSWMFGMDNTGKLAGPIVGGFIATSWGVRAPFVIYGFLALLALIPTFAFTEDTPRRARTVAADAPRQPMTIREIVMPRLVYFAVVFFAALARGPLWADLLYLYAAFAYHLSAKEIGLLATSAACISLPIGFIAGWLLDKFGRKRAMIPGFIGVMLTMGGLAVTAFFHFSFQWYLAIFLCGVAMQALTGGSIQTIGTDVAPPEAQGKFLGLWRFAQQGGTAISPLIFATLASRVDYGSSFIFISSAAGVVAYLMLRHIPETGNVPARGRVGRARPKDSTQTPRIRDG